MPRKILSILTEVLVDNLADPVIGIDKEGKIHLYNLIAAQLFGVPVLKALGSKIWDVLPMTDFTKAVIAVIKESHPTATERMYEMTPGHMYIGYIQPVRNEENRLCGAVASLKDVTHLQKLEAGVTDFVSSLSGQLVLPLTSVKGFVETLLEGAMADPQVTRKFLQIINDETNRMARLLTGLQAASLQAQQLEKGAVRLHDVADKAVQRLLPLAEQKKVKMEKSGLTELPVYHGDADRLGQVVTNLLDNAIKSSGLKGGGRVVIAGAVEAGAIRLTVQDDGVGITAADQERIFERFYRVQQGPAAQLGGTGLGLSVARDIVKAHGGRIEVASETDRGATFTVTLPLSP